VLMAMFWRSPGLPACPSYPEYIQREEIFSLRLSLISI
jgi:hypothetical protein